jgi:hypothetical protein
MVLIPDRHGAFLPGPVVFLAGIVERYAMTCGALQSHPPLKYRRSE